MGHPRYNFLYENTPNGIVVYDGSGRITDANPAAERILGVPLVELKGRRAECSCWPQGLKGDSESAAQVNPVWLALETGEEVHDMVTVFMNEKTGEQCWIKSHALPERRAGEDKPFRVFAVIQDITDQKNSAEALAQSKSRFEHLYQEFQAILNGIDESMIRIDPDYKIVWANRKAGEIVNRHSDTLAGRRCYEVWQNSSVPCEKCPVAECFRTGKPQEMVISGKNGGIFGAKTFPLLDQDGRIASVLEITVDITEKIKLREDAEHRTRLAYLGELAAGVAHEINNPNGHIRINAQILEECSRSILPILEERYSQGGDFPLGNLPFSRLRRELPRMHREIRESSEKVKQIVEDLKNFAQTGTREGVGPVSLNDAVEPALRLAGSYLRQATHRFMCDLQDPLPHILGDVRRLEQVVINLLTNACQALPSREAGIRLQTRSDASSNSVQLIVADEGTGIDPENIPKVTQPFFTTREGRGGTGLGLSVTANLIKEFQGTMVFDSEPGHGTKVTVTFPAIQSSK